jgi:hypothetical protein
MCLPDGFTGRFNGCGGATGSRQRNNGKRELSWNAMVAARVQVGLKHKIHVDCVERRRRAKDRCREKFSIYLSKAKTPVERNCRRLCGRNMQF